MNNLNKIKEAIINDPSNIEKTKLGIMPLYQVSENSKIIIIGQAPGQKAEESGIAWNDLSGDKLRDWLGVSRNQFYDDNIFGIIPMDFYYPGKANHGDLPPRKEFAEMWHSKILKELKEIKLIILVGNYAQKYYLKDKVSLTNRVKNYKNYLPKYFVLVHPSPLNFRWQAKNPWFMDEVIPDLRIIIQHLIAK